MQNNLNNIAIVHDWFLTKSLGGAEKVTKLIDQYLCSRYKEPDIFCVAENISTTNEFNIFPNRKIKSTFIQKLPLGNKKVQYYLPLIPFAIEQLNLSNYDLIISSSHLAAKGILISPSQLHISYIHTPMRYAWDQMNTYLEQSKLSKIGLEIIIRYILFKLRQWDFLSSRRPDYLISNSNFTSQRIKKYWGLESEVIHPPVNIERFNFKQNRSDFYLTVNRLVPNKRTDLLVKAFNKLNLPLIIVGDGPERKKLKKIANNNIKFYFNKNNQEVANLMSECRAFVYAGIEDFGIAPVEAMAAGAPVIALGKGGLLDTVVDFRQSSKGEFSTGIFFKEQSVACIVDTINWFEDKSIWKQFNSKDINNYSKKFKPEEFTYKFSNFTEKALESFCSKRKINSNFIR